jgi:hypothetical protein
MTILLLMILLMMMIVYYDDDGDVDVSDDYDDGDHDTCDVKYNPDGNNSIITVLHIHKCEINVLLIV